MACAVRRRRSPVGANSGVFLYGEAGRREIALPGGGRYSGRHNVLDDMGAAIRSGRPPVHDGRWGKATVEVALAIQQSARERREVTLAHQGVGEGR